MAHRENTMNDTKDNIPLLSPIQSAFALLGEHPEEPPLHLRRPRHRGGGRLAVGHRPDLHGCLHQERAQTQPGEHGGGKWRGGGRKLEEVAGGEVEKSE